MKIFLNPLLSIQDGFDNAKNHLTLLALQNYFVFHSRGKVYEKNVR